jgi:hypothetical protein
VAEDVTVIREPKRDTFGNRPAGTVNQWLVPGWDFAPGPSLELAASANTIESDGTLYGPPVTVINEIVPSGIQPDDKIRVRGSDYEVVGRVQDWGVDGSVIVLKYVTG